MFLLLAQLEPRSNFKKHVNRERSGKELWVWGARAKLTLRRGGDPVWRGVQEFGEVVGVEQFDRTLWSWLWLLRINRLYMRAVEEKTWQTWQLPSSLSFPKTWQDTMANRHLDHAFHIDRTEVNQKLSFRNSEVHGDAAAVLGGLLVVAARVLG